MREVKKNIIKFAALFILVSIFSLGIGSMKANASWQEIKVPVKSYELDKGNDYDFTNVPVASQMSYGKSSIGTFTITGSINNTGLYDSRTAYGVEAGNIAFSYDYSGYMMDSSGDNHLVSDKTKKILGDKLDANILYGVLLVQKSEDGINWENAVSPVVNYLETNNQGRRVFYTTNGDDVAKGMFYRVILAYKTEVKTGTGQFLWKETDKTATYRNMEVYEFFLCKNDAVISVHNISADVSGFETEEYSVEVLKKGETLTDGATVTKGFYIDKLGTTYSVTVNGVEAYDRKRFTQNGKYTIVTKTKLGKQSTKTIYIFNGGDDNGFSTYFGDSIINGKRVFREGEYPTYAVNSAVRVQKIDESTPTLTGQIQNLDTGDILLLDGSSREEQRLPLAAGLYQADLYSGKTESGTVFHYTFIFNILSEDAKPYVNYNELMNLERLSDLQTKHYEVVYPTTAGGYISACFADYDDAFAYAYEIEKRYVEKNTDGVYYKSEENPNQKVKYKTDKNEDKIKLTRLINYYASQNVEIRYFNPAEKFTFQTYSSENDLLKCLESMSISESIKVFSSQAEKEKMLSRVPFLNGYSYMHVDDYDVKSVVATSSDGESVFNLSFGRNIDNQISKSSQYTITETNKYGDELTYEASFMNSNVTESKWIIYNNGVSTEVLVNGTTTVEADQLYIKESYNLLDEWAIVTVETEDAYSYSITCLVSEIEGLTLYKPGNYTITFVDRVGNSYRVYVTISGNSSKIETGVTFTEKYNSIYLNDKTYDEETQTSGGR